jgi:RHS repeat-associated protein
VTRRALDPYGNPLDTTPWPVARGFLDKAVSEHTGLTDVGARKYDAATGRFLSVDPVVDGTNPLSLTGYGYGNSNPVTNSDPSGLIIANHGPDGADGPKRASQPADYTSPARAPVPTVKDGDLQKKINQVYLREIVKGNGFVSDGTTAGALRAELTTGEKTGKKGGGTFHHHKAVAAFNGIAQWLEDARKAEAKKPGSVDKNDIAVAESEAKKLWEALNAPDVAGKVTQEILDLRASDPDKYAQWRQAVEAKLDLPAISHLTGSTFEATKYGVPKLVTKGALPGHGLMILNVAAFGVAVHQQGWKGATLDLMDPMGVREMVEAAQCDPSDCIA